MPGFDRTGPFGTGPNGWGMGPCGGGGAFGRGRFFRRGGFGFGRGYFSQEISPEEEKTYLENRKGWLESEIEALTKKLNEYQK